MIRLIEKIEKKSILKTALKWCLAVLILGLLAVVIIYARVQTKYSDKILTLDEIKSDYRYAVVFGAGLKSRGVPGEVLEDRVLAAIDLYQAGKVDYLVLSGDNQSANHNEVQAMKNLAAKEGLSEKFLLLDHAGLSTYDSCWRAKEILKLDKVVLVTQKYHLRRALYICNELGLDAVGFEPVKKDYPKQWQYTFRESLASINDFLKLLIN